MKSEPDNKSDILFWYLNSHAVQPETNLVFAKYSLIFISLDLRGPNVEYQAELEFVVERDKSMQCCSIPAIIQRQPIQDGKETTGHQRPFAAKRARKINLCCHYLALLLACWGLICNLQKYAARHFLTEVKQ